MLYCFLFLELSDKPHKGEKSIRREFLKTAFFKYSLKGYKNQGEIQWVLYSFINIFEKDKTKHLSFYRDLEKSIKEVSQAIKSKGFSIYVVGNRTVKNITLATDQFIAEQFEKNGFRHILSYERVISSKVMPAQNSPTNRAGQKVNTMHKEYIIVCRKS